MVPVYSPTFGHCDKLNTLKPRYNDPFYYKIPAIKNLISRPSVVQFSCNKKIPAIKNKTFQIHYTEGSLYSITSF